MKTAIRCPAGTSLESARADSNHCSYGCRSNQRVPTTRRLGKRLWAESDICSGGLLRRSLINASRRLVENLFISSKQLNQSNQEIRRIKQSGAEFMSKVSHDLRTPLNVIIGFSELMLDEVPGKINETQKQSLNDILNSAKRLVDLVNGFPDMKRRTSGKRE